MPPTTTAESDKIEINTGQKSLSGQEFYIVTDEMGYYRITTKGEGVTGSIGNERFTAVGEARKRVEEYKNKNFAKLGMRARWAKQREEAQQED